MSDLKKAASSWANDYYDESVEVGPVDNFYRAFLAGASWQRERDARVRTVLEEITQSPVTRSWADWESKIARAKQALKTCNNGESTDE